MKKIFISSLLIIGIVFILQSQSGTSTSKAKGKEVYNKYCLACHQSDGGGVPRMNPPLSGTDYVNGNKQRVIGIVLNGLNTPLEINGETYENPMASHAFLKDQQIADVLTYIRSSFGNKSTAVTATEVKAVRAKMK
jgi:mono/diheme cytochrome c family protein